MVNWKSPLTASVVACVLALGCKPNIEGRPSLIDSGRVIAVQSSPAEASPDSMSTLVYHALYATPSEGDDTSAKLSWAYCNVRKPIALIGPAAEECLVPASKALEQLGRGDTIEDVMLEKHACDVFGPTPPPPEKGQPPSRAADPDITGGYYQPIRVLVPTDEGPDYVVGVTRLNCGLANANQDQAAEYATRYRPNENPKLATVVMKHTGGRSDIVVSDDPDTPAVAATVKRGERVTFRATWVTCPLKATCGDGICGEGEFAENRKVNGVDIMGCPDDCSMPVGCTGSEPYIALDPISRKIVDHRESMRVSWFATDGSFDHDRTGRTEDDANDAFSENGWVAPSSKGTVHFWFVLRDDRGGVGWSPPTSIDVEP